MCTRYVCNFDLLEYIRDNSIENRISLDQVYQHFSNYPENEMQRDMDRLVEAGYIRMEENTIIYITDTAFANNL